MQVVLMRAAVQLNKNALVASAQQTRLNIKLHLHKATVVIEAGAAA